MNTAKKKLELQEQSILSKNFGVNVFSFSLMKSMLPPEVYENIKNAIFGYETLDKKNAEIIATALKQWAINRGATRYSHWFQPMIGKMSEKQESFFDLSVSDNESNVIENLSGDRLFQVEISGSAFPSGGLRNISESRAYTIWDPSTPPFLWEKANEITLCIPSIYVSWQGNALGNRLPVLRSEKNLNQAALRLLNLLTIEASFVVPTLGIEQEYYLIANKSELRRPDLLLIGETVYGNASVINQQALPTNQFRPMSPATLAFMKEFEEAAIKLGIPVKSRHRETSRCQYEITLLYEKTSLAIDHNILLMELMKQIAKEHNFICTFHERPFQGFNASGKHCNWSLITNDGLNLFDPNNNPLLFLVFITAFIHAVEKHAGLIRASVGSFSNDQRFGAYNAPSSIVSLDLGEYLEKALTNFERTGVFILKNEEAFDLKLSYLPHLYKDQSDRNRTSPISFTGNKFEFKAVGSSTNTAFPIMVLNTIVSESINEICDAIEKETTTDSREKHITNIAQAFLKKSNRIRFTGNTYLSAWEKEAQKRKLVTSKNSVDTFAYLTEKNSIKAFENILNEEELESRHNVLLEQYVKEMSFKHNFMIDIYFAEILPALTSLVHTCNTTYSTQKSIKHAKQLSQEITLSTDKSLALATNIATLLAKNAREINLLKKATYALKTIAPEMEKLRLVVDDLEKYMSSNAWPLAKYRDIFTQN